MGERGYRCMRIREKQSLFEKSVSAAFSDDAAFCQGIPWRMFGLYPNIFEAQNIGRKLLSLFKLFAFNLQAEHRCDMMLS